MALFGPFGVVMSPHVHGLKWHYVRKDWYRSKPVGREPTPYYSVNSKVAGTDRTMWFTATFNRCHSICTSYTSSSDSETRTRLLNKAYAGLVSKIRGEHGGVEGMTFLAEYRSGFAMVANRALQWQKAYQALRKGRFREFLRVWGVKALPKHKELKRTKAKETAGLWLEYWFGWAPSLNDVYNACNLTQQPIPAQKFSARASEPFGGSTNAGMLRESWVGMAYARQSATVTVNNPNLWLANQLGMINPAATLWNLTPFSWLVDWWANVGDYLNSFTDFFGLNITQPTSTVMCKAAGTHRNTDPWYAQSVVSDVYSWRRSLGLHKPVLSVQPLRTLSVTRALTSVSLLVQLFLNPDKVRA